MTAPATGIAPAVLERDRDAFLTRTARLWEGLRGGRVFVTGGTGFVGSWLLESFLWANRGLGLGAKLLVLTRDEGGFKRRRPRLAGAQEISLQTGDVRSFEFPKGRFAAVVHAATDASASLNDSDPLLMMDTIVSGTRRALEFAGQSGASSFLMTSSGAVYGRQPSDIELLSEDHPGGPDPASPASAYAEGKRLAELMCAAYADKRGLRAQIARCFAFGGPYLQLDRHYAMGNFLRDALKGGPIRVSGDGSPLRSYLYGADLAEWLWTILLNGRPGRPYNVGSEEAVTVGDLAREVAEEAGTGIQVELSSPPAPRAGGERYVPSTARARSELGLREMVGRREGIRRSLEWLRTAEEQ